MSTSTRAENQPRQALQRANAIRLARVGLRHRIAVGDLSAAEVVLTCPPEARSWPVARLLASQPRWGDSRTRRFLWRHQIPELKPVGKLTDRQRRMLAAELQRPRQ